MMGDQEELQEKKFLIPEKKLVHEDEKWQKDGREKQVEKIAPWKYSNHFSAYLSRFEDIMENAGLVQAE